MQRADRLVTVFGGSGFLGRHIIRQLAKAGWRVRVAVRRPDLAGHLQPLGAVGQIMPVQANLRYPDSVRAAAEGADAIINCVGILYESGRQKFDAVQAKGADAVAQAAADVGARLVHLSAIGADVESPSVYARTKGAGEAAVRSRVPGAVILRPSIVFGPEDDFFNRFAGLAQMSPFLPLVGGGETRFQPVFVGDVAEVVARAVNGDVPPGIYELGGPEVKSFRDLLSFVLDTTERSRLLVPIPFWGARLKAKVLQFAPKPLLTPDQVTLLERDNVVSDGAKAEGRTLEGLGISAQSVEAIVPTYLWRFRKQGQFAERAS